MSQYSTVHWVYNILYYTFENVKKSSSVMK